MAVAFQNVGFGVKVVLTSFAMSMLGTATAAVAESSSVTYNFDIPAQKLNDALQALAFASQHKLLYSSKLVDGKDSPALKGKFTTEEAVKQLLFGTGLVYQITADGLLVIRGPMETADSITSLTTRDAAIRLAQSETASASEAPKDMPERKADSALEEIIVTATKREENVQDVPISIAVISNQDIERRGLIGMEDYLRSVPSVNQIDRGGLDNAIVIRGITTSPQSENFSSGATVATYFNETPITASGGLGGGGIDVRPADMERIEVLRGPQGTTYGSASLGGAMRLIPARPQLDRFGGKVVASYSSTEGAGGDNAMFQGVLNAPIAADRFGVRVVGYRYDDSGFYRNIAGLDPATLAAAERFGATSFVSGYEQDDVGRISTIGGRVAALWHVTDRLDVSANFLRQAIEQDGAPVATNGPYQQARIPVNPRGRLRGEAGEVHDLDIEIAELVLQYDLGWADLTSAVSRMESGSDIASTIVPIPQSSTLISDVDSLTAEVRLTSQLEGRFRFLAGVFYQDLHNDFLQQSFWSGSSATNTFGTNPTFYSAQDRTQDERAIFGEVSYNLTDKITATLGGRFFEYDKTQGTLNEGGRFRVPLGAGVRTQIESSESENSYKAGISYKPVRDALLYASWAQGFRLGQPANGVPPATCDTNGDGLVDGTGVSIESTKVIDSDFLDSYEVGGKFGFFDRRMLVDASVYHINWDGLPIRALTPAPCLQSYVANAGAAESDGAEIQVSLLVATGLRLDLGGSYVRAKLTNDAPALSAQEGARLPGSPKVSANLAAQYDFTVAGYKTFIRADSLYAGKFYGDLIQSPSTLAGDYVKVDLRAGLTIGSTTAELFVRNLTNEDAYTWRSTAPGAPSFGYRLRPRTIGLQLGYKFE